ncbi:MAG: SHOCT domain-containing protein, partial [Microthrixaceae bacterium]
DYPLLDNVISMLWFFLFFMWIWIAVMVVVDIFRSSDMGGFAKAVWFIFVVLVPYLGVFIYLIARGGKMHERQIADATAQQQAFDQYVQQTAGSGDVATQLEKLAGLRDQGVISAQEFEAQKAKLLAS